MPNEGNLKKLLAEIGECDSLLAATQDKRRNLVLRLGACESMVATVLDRFKSGDSIVSSGGRRFWCDSAGNLIRAVYNEESDGLAELVALGVIAKETKHHGIY
jgi:hypothetical protein